MKARLALPVILAAAIAACGRFPSPPTAIPTQRPPSSSTPTPTDRAPFQFPDRIVITSSSLSLAVEDPPAAMARLEALVEEAGGFVSSASSWADPQNAYASLSAKVPPEALPGLRREAIALASVVASNSTYSQDVTSEVRSLQDRLALVDDSENRLLQILLETSDPSLAKSYVLVAELFRQERQNAESQLHNYLDSSRLSSFDVSMNRPSTLLPVDPVMTPLPYLQ